MVVVTITGREEEEEEGMEVDTGHRINHIMQGGQFISMADRNECNSARS